MIGLAPWWVVFILMPVLASISAVVFGFAAGATLRHVSTTDDDDCPLPDGGQ